MQIAPHTKLVFAEASFPFCNCLLIEDDIRVLVDTGMGPKTMAGINPDAIQLVINTHHHFDHVHQNDRFTGAEVLVHPLEMPPMQSLEALGYYSGVQLWSELMGNERPTLGQGAFADSVRTRRVTGCVEDNTEIVCGKTRFTVVHLPGHSPGHLGMYFEKEGVLFTGDIDFTSFGPWYGSYVCSVDEYLSSLDKIEEINPARIYTSHRRRVATDCKKAVAKYRDILLLREDRIVRAIREGKNTLDTLAVLGICSPEIKDVTFLFWEKMMLLKHLDRLVRAGVIKEEGKQYRIAN